MRTLFCDFFFRILTWTQTQKKRVAQDKPSSNVILDFNNVCYGFVGLEVFLPIVMYIICCSHICNYWEIYVFDLMFPKTSLDADLDC